MDDQNKRVLGINGLGRIGKLTVWHQVHRKHFTKLVVNIGREVGTRLEDVAHYIENDSTYGSIHNYLYGNREHRIIEQLDESKGIMVINGVEVKVLRGERNPGRIPWESNEVKIVVDATGAYLDPTQQPDDPVGSLSGHLQSGAKKVIVSAPFDIKSEHSSALNYTTIVMGINDSEYMPRKHDIISNSSCTINCLVYMLKPLIDTYGSDIISAAVLTIHSVTSSQRILDHAPMAKETDLRKDRSAFNNIILSEPLPKTDRNSLFNTIRSIIPIPPKMQPIPCISDMVRVPITKGSLIVLDVMIQDVDKKDENRIKAQDINQIYIDAISQYPEGYLVFSKEQNVSSDIMGFSGAAAIIEGFQNHVRSGNAHFDICKIVSDAKFLLDHASSLSPESNAFYQGLIKHCATDAQRLVEVPVTQAMIYGWYDNEMGSYTKMLGDLTVKVHDELR